MLAHTLITLAADQPAGIPDPGPAPTTIGYGGLLVGVGGIIYAVAKWKHINADAKRMFTLGIIVAVLLGSTTGIFGTISNSLRQTGDSVGTSVTNTTTGQR